MKEAIKEIDERLSELRQAWLDAEADKKAFWLSKINKQLDKRLEEMKKP